MALLGAILAQVCSGSDHVKEVSTYVKHHSRAMSKEIEQRVHAGAKYSLANHHAKKLSAVEPTAMPTSTPTEDPNLSPTGYMYLTNSFNSDCSNPVVSVGFPVNTCLTDDSLPFFKIRIVDDDWSNAYINYYSDAQCLQLTESGIPYDQEQVQCQKTDSPVVTDPSNPNGNVYSQLFISTSATPPRISDAGGGLFEHFEGSATCFASSFGSYLIYTSKVCLLDADAKAFRVDCNNELGREGDVRMTLDSDNQPDCMGFALVNINFPGDVCEGSLADDDDSVLRNMYDLRRPPTPLTTPFPPTFLPTSAPFVASPSATASPTVEGTEVSQRVTCQAALAPTKAFTFKVIKQIINDFTVDTYDSDADLYGLTLKQAIATTMPDVIASGITNLVVTADSAARTVRRALQGASAVSLAYTVSGMSRVSAPRVAAQLQAGLVSGAFDSALHLLALQNNATGLVNATSNSASFYIEDDSDSETLSGGAIAGIVIGCVAFSVIVGALIWCFATKRMPSVQVL